MANLRVDKITSTETFETTGSVQFDGTTDFLTISSNTDFAMGTGDFTAECWIYLRGYSDAEGGYSERVFDSNTGQLGIYITSDGTGYVGALVGGTDIRSSTAPDLQSWSHLAISRSGTTFRLFLNGTQILSRENSSSVASSGNFLIGARASGEGGFRGHISNFRILKGKALYTSNFTPPTRELTVIPNTVLLCCQSTTRANEERTGKTITVNGNAVANELTPGLLTDRIRSGGSSSISGSVEFDGTGDYLSLANNNEFDFDTSMTIEAYVYFSDLTSSPVVFSRGGGNTSSSWSTTDGAQFAIYGTSTGRISFEYNSSGTPIQIISATGTLSANSWNHIAITYNGTTFTLYLNGINVGTASNAPTMPTTRSNIWVGMWPTSALVQDMKGFISNLRVIRGTALYTQNFIPPTRELKNLPGTVLLCCQNSKSATQEATGKTITVNGNATARYFTPPVGFDGFVNFDGATKIKSPNYFYLPTGTTEDRGRGRGVFGGGYVPGTSQNTIQFINIQSSGIVQDFGDLSSNMGSADGKAPCAAASATRALFASGYSAPGPVNTIEYVTISTTSNSTDFGDLTTNRRDLGACSSSTRAVFGGGTTTGSTSATNVIEYVTIASLGNTVSFGTLTQARRGLGSCSSSTRGIFGGGYVSNSPATRTNRIDYVTIATTGNASIFGDLTVVRGGVNSCSSSTRGIFAGGSIYVAPASTFYNTIDYITISSTGNATDFGDLSSTRAYGASCSNSIRGVFGGGYSPSHTNTIDFVLISSTGNATDFGDLLSAALYYNGGCSDSHGGLG